MPKIEMTVERWVNLIKAWEQETGRQFDLDTALLVLKYEGPMIVGPRDDVLILVSEEQIEFFNANLDAIRTGLEA